jgi:hypothetical protein
MSSRTASFFKTYSPRYIQIGRTHLVGQIVPRFKSYCVPNENLGSPKKVEQKVPLLGTKSIFLSLRTIEIRAIFEILDNKKANKKILFFFSFDFDASRTPGVTC